MVSMEVGFLARIYGGVLGLLAMILVIIRNLIHGAGTSEALLTAMVALAIFTVVGMVIGRLADWIVLESVWIKVGAELKSQGHEPEAEGAKQ